MTDARGAETPQGPGWWLASDGRYYPPHLSPGSGARSGTSSSTPASSSSTPGATPPTAAKKKVVKKKVVSAKAAAAAAGARPKKKVVKKKAPAKPTGDPTVDLTEKRPGHLKYTAKPPPSDQVAARRIQAKEQMVLLAGARQDAALRLLASLGEPVEPVLVGVGGRDLDARHLTADHLTADHPTETAPEARLGGLAVGDPETDVAAPDEELAVDPASPSSRSGGGAGGPVPPTPGLAAPPDHHDEAVAAAPPEIDDDAGDEVDEVEPDDTAPAASDQAQPAPPAEARPAPHQPTRGPAPTAGSMGTDVPFMEVKGSALGTDIDRIGERILIFADRVELRDRSHAVRQTIRYDQLASIEVQKKMMGPTLLITSVAGATMTAKALRPELATGAKAMIEKHAARFRGEAGPPPAPSEADQEAAPPPPPAASAPDPGDAPAPAAPRTHRSVLLAMLDELHTAGILSPEELEQKRALVERAERP